jgi:RNA polymerase sigma-70 factor (ECF subfamily)
MRFLDSQSLAQHTDRLYRAAWALCGSPEEAEDLVEETFARVLRRPRLLHGESSDLTVLMCALRNNFLTSRRDPSGRPGPAGAPQEVDPVDPRATREAQEEREVRELYAAIASLPEAFRLTLVAVDVMGLSYRDAASSLGVPRGTVPTRLFQARRLLTHQLAKGPKPEDPTPEDSLGIEPAAGAGGG